MLITMMAVFEYYLFFTGLVSIKCFAHLSDRLDNVAIGKTCDMSTAWKKGATRIACKGGINNDTLTDYNNNNNGIHTDMDDYNPWWEVYLLRIYPIINITIWPRTAVIARMASLKVMVDNNQCFKFPSDYSDLNKSVPVCSPSNLSGSIIRVIKNSSSNAGFDYFININEIQVWSCKSGYWGNGCQDVCGKCKTGSGTYACDPLSGICDLCNPGWKPPSCSKECDDLTFGQNCTSNCNTNCEDICNKTTGNCSCKPGWKYPNCSEECTNNTWGKNCANECGSGCTTSCDVKTGECSCGPGWQYPLCKDECKPGTFGQNCAGVCGSGCNRTSNSSSCDRTNGSCTCMSGWHPPTCQQQIGMKDDLNIGVIIGPIVGVLVLVVAALIIALFMRKHGLRENKNSRFRVDIPIYQNVLEDRSVSKELPSITSNPPKKQKAEVKPFKTDIKEDSSSPSEGNIYANVSTNDRPSPPLASSPSNPLPQQKTVTDETKTDDEETVVDNEEDLYYYSDDAYIRKHLSDLGLDSLQMHLLQQLRGGDITAEFKTLTTGLQKDHEAGLAKVNYYKNRFQTVLPYDSTRVILRSADQDLDSDYINASYIRNFDGVNKAYIAAQGPRSNTVDDFWKMIWQEEITHIVMLTKTIEADKNKCEEYWPATKQKKAFGKVEVTGIDLQRRSDFFIRDFDVVFRPSKKRRVRQYHYITWPDHSIPTTIDLVDFWNTVKADHRSKLQTSPLLVHCSAGVGRTGAYIALDVSFDEAQKNQEVDLRRVVESLREDRCSMVQGAAQYRFLHEALLEAYTARGSRLAADEFDKTFTHDIQPELPHAHLDGEYQRLEQMKVLLNKPKHDEAENVDNINKIRNPNILPDDRYLVYLKRHVAGRNQFVNAVYMSTYLSFRGAILTQLPTADTKVDFWRLVEGDNIETIVSLGGVDEHEISQGYWPCGDKKSLTIGPYKLELENKNKLGECLTCYSVKYKFANESAVYRVRLFHYSAWSGETPTNTFDLLRLLDELLTLQTGNINDPLLIQCFDGTTKSGLFSAICNTITRFALDHVVDVYKAVRHVQTVRPECIMSVVQYRYIFYILQAYNRRSQIYANV